MEAAASVVVVGIGNRDRGDDGVGPAVACRLRSQLPPSVRVTTNDSERLLDLVLAWDGVDTAFLIDAACSGAEPGTIHRLEGPDRAAFGRLVSCSTHSFGVAEALELARALGHFPRRLVVYAVEAEALGHGQELSPRVCAAVAQVAGRIGEEVAHILSGA